MTTRVHIRGKHETRQVWIDGKELTPDVSLVVFRHSPDGFEWGYGGSGPAQLALAILLKFCDADVAVNVHQRFKSEVVARFPARKDFEIHVDVRDWIDRVTKGGRHADF